MSLTPMEELALEVCQEVLDVFSIGRTSRTSYLQVMGSVRNLVTKLENKKFGCETGRHSRRCDCGKG